MKIIPGVKPIVDKEVQRAFCVLPLQDIFTQKDLCLPYYYNVRGS